MLLIDSACLFARQIDSVCIGRAIIEALVLHDDNFIVINCYGLA